MSAPVTIWHNPRCSKSRQTLARLRDAGVEPQVRLYLADPPDGAEIAAARDALGRPLIEMLRKGEAAFRAAGLSATSPEPVLLAAMAAHPILIERPIVFRGDRAVIGRPPEAVDALI